MSFITIEEAREVLQSIKFLNWTFEINEHREGTFGLRLTDYVKDSQSSDPTPIRILTMKEFTPPYSKQSFVIQLWEIINQRLRHEAGELFEVNGKFPYDEHTGEGTAFIASIYPEEAFAWEKPKS